MKRVAIIGVGGAGKSWLATRLGARLALPVIHLDQHYWRPGWAEPSRDEWRAQQVALLDEQHPEGWVADGNYGGTMDLRFARADTVVFIDPPSLLAVYRVVRRQLRGDNPAAPPDVARWNREFLRFLRYVWRYRRARRPIVVQRLTAFGGQVHHLRTRRDVQAFLAAIPPVRDARRPEEDDGPG